MLRPPVIPPDPVCVFHNEPWSTCRACERDSRISGLLFVGAIAFAFTVLLLVGLFG